jgi:hypothetical protein
MTHPNNDPASSSIGDVAANIARVQQMLPFDHLETAASNLADAGATIAGVGNDSTRLQEVVNTVGVAQEKLGQVVAAITTGHNALSAYTADIGVASEPPHATHAGTSAAETGNMAAPIVRYERGNGKYIVTERTIGDTSFRVVMSRHSDENAPEIAAAMGRCDVIAVEDTGPADAAERRFLEGALTRILSTDIDPEVANALLKYVDPFIVPMLQSHIGTGAKVKLLDINKDHPDYHLIGEADTAFDVFLAAMYDLQPTAIARAAAEKSIAADKASIAPRDAIDRVQFAEIAAEAGDATVGVMIGTMHPGALTGMQSPNGETTGDLKKRLWSRGGYSSNMAPLAPPDMTEHEVVDRMILHQYMKRFAKGSSVDPEIIATHVGPQKLANILRVVDETIADDSTAEEKKQYLGHYFKAVIDIVCEDIIVTRPEV